MADNVHIIKTTKELVDTVLAWQSKSIRYVVADGGWLVMNSAGQGSALALSKACKEAQPFLEASGISIDGSGS